MTTIVCYDIMEMIGNQYKLIKIEEKSKKKYNNIVDILNDKFLEIKNMFLKGFVETQLMRNICIERRVIFNLETAIPTLIEQEYDIMEIITNNYIVFKVMTLKMKI